MQVSLEKALDLLGVEQLPGDKEQQKLLRRFTEELVQKHGEQWVRDNQQRLVVEWERLVEEFLPPMQK